MVNNAVNVPWTKKFLYGIGRLADGIKISSFNVFLFFYFNQVLGLSATLCGVAVFLALCVDAVTDPMIGHLSDRFKSRWGRRRPFMLMSLLPLSGCFYLVFSPPEGLTQTLLFLWLLFFAVIVRVSVSLFTIPHSALGAEISSDYHERSSIYGISTFFGYFGGIGAAVVGYTVFFVATPEHPNGLLNAEAYSGYAFWGACVMFISILICWGGTRSLPILQNRVEQQNHDTSTSLYQNLFLALKNDSFRYLFIGSILTTLVVGTREALTLYMGTYYWELSAEQIALLLIGYLFGIFVAALLVKPFHHFFDKKATLIGASLAFVVLSSLGTTLRLIGYFPENGSPLLLPFILTGSLVATVFGIMAVITVNSMIADIADEHEYLNHSRSEGIYFSAIAFAGKAASGLGHLFAGIAIDLIAFPENAVPGKVGEETLINLGLIEGPLLGAFGLFSAVMYMRYKLSRQRHAEILSQLQLRQAELVV